ncbi:BTAD domain-containing putative transcriptional regulator [Nocardioides pakistanensis]
MGTLGPTEAWRGDARVDLGTRKQRALLAALALHRGRPVSADTLVDLLWAGRAPGGVTATLQSYVAGLRRALEPERPARTASRVLVTVAPGYALALPDTALDVTRFEAAVSSAHRVLAPMAAVPAGGTTPATTSAADLAHSVATLDEALALWRGSPFLELEDAPAAVAERVRLEELRLVALEDKAAAGIALGHHAPVAADLEALTSAYPLRERLWALRAIALTRSGRQADALDVLGQVRRLLAEELGIEPGGELQRLQTAVLRQDPDLAFVPPAGGPAATTLSGAPAGLVREPRPDAPRRATGHPRPSWPLVGRAGELTALVATLDGAAGGIPQFAVVVGEPGMGKSRLTEELAAVATARGVRVLLGRCSQDEGAPPLWPWADVLAELGHSLPVEAGTQDESTRFRVWDDICTRVLEASREQPLLVVLDDLHWADVSSLRVLGLLLETAREGALAVVATWRDKPPPTGPLAAVADGLARRHALRLHLAGLDADQVAEMVHTVADTEPTAEQAAALRARTEGNPFFLVEYARLVEHGGDLAGLLAEPDPPAAVQDVLARRVERLPADSARLLRTASVIGRDFDLGTLARATGTGEDEALDALDSAISAGLVLDAGADRFRFAHALVRDTVYTALSPSRRSRAHRLVAEALEGHAGRETEVARHWLAAGPTYAGHAWRAAVAAAHEARLVYAYDEAQLLLEQAVALLDDDASASTVDEYDVLMSLATTLRLAGKWVDLRRVVHRMIELADWVGDVELLARAATVPSSGALWQAAYHGERDEVTIDALRRALDELPPGDSVLRCRALLGLATETYYGACAEEREALAREGLAMARRIGDPSLRLEACQTAFVSIWRAATAEHRRALAEEAVRLAHQIEDPSALTAALTVRAVVAGELGDVDTMQTVAAEARRRAEQHRQLYPLVVLDSLEVPWHAMRGEWDLARRLTDHLVATGERMALAQLDNAVAGAELSIGMWQRVPEQLLPRVLEAEDHSNLSVTPAVLALLVRAGRIEEARAHRAARTVDLTADNWFSMLPWSLAAEAALALQDTDLARTSYDLLAPYAGRPCMAGSGMAFGPVDAFLAMSAAALGETELATQHAESALELCRAWRIPLAEQWLHDQRDRYRF